MNIQQIPKIAAAEKLKSDTAAHVAKMMKDARDTAQKTVADAEQSAALALESTRDQVATLKKKAGHDDALKAMMASGPKENLPDITDQKGVQDAGKEAALRLANAEKALSNMPSESR